MRADGRRAIPFPEGPLPRPWPAVLSGLAIAYTAVLLFATHHPRPQELLGPEAPGDKTLHFFAYGVLGGITSAAIAARGGWRARSAFALFAILALFAAADEITQPLFGRFADAADWAFDEVGLVAGIGSLSAVVAAIGSRAASQAGSRADRADRGVPSADQ